MLKCLKMPRLARRLFRLVDFFDFIRAENIYFLDVIVILPVLGNRRGLARWTVWSSAVYEIGRPQLGQVHIGALDGYFEDCQEPWV